MKIFKKDWTHKDVEILDIRKLSQLYVISIKSKDIDKPLFVKDKIFEERVNSYFLCNSNSHIAPITREDILGIKWNLYITKGGYIKIQNGEVIEYNEKCDPNKYYISFLEISGPLGSFESVLKTTMI